MMRVVSLELQMFNRIQIADMQIGTGRKHAAREAGKIKFSRVIARVSGGDAPETGERTPPCSQYIR